MAMSGPDRPGVRRLRPARPPGRRTRRGQAGRPWDLVAEAPGRTRRPLVITADGDLLDDLLRLGAASGTDLQVAQDPAAARGHYTTAPLVLIGADQAAACQRARLPRRADVILVAIGEDPSSHGSTVDTQARRASAGPAGADPWEHVAALGASHVAILPVAEPWLLERLASSGSRDEPAPVVAVLGGRGGAGASVLAAGLAVTAAAFGHRVLLVDADSLGGGLDLVLGWEDDGGLRWPELTGSSGRLDPGALVGALPSRGDLALLSFDRRDLPTAAPEAMAAVLAAGRAARDLVVVDTPRRLDPAAVVALQTADQGLLVVPAVAGSMTARPTSTGGWPMSARGIATPRCPGSRRCGRWTSPER